MKIMEDMAQDGVSDVLHRDIEMIDSAGVALARRLLAAEDAAADARLDQAEREAAAERARELRVALIDQVAGVFA